jgi:hypothetical protein
VVVAGRQRALGRRLRYDNAQEEDQATASLAYDLKSM